jgi:hypothetical protein
VGRRTFLVGVALVAGLASCRGQDVVPPQPVPFSHRVHAGVNGIGCTMCHAYAERSVVAGIPSMARCVGCHKFIGRDKPAVQLVLKTNEEGKVLAWNRVYVLPDHVYFTHERHVSAGLRCQECHGEIQTMDVTRRARALTMGWCVDCHRKREAPAECVICHK